MSSPEMSLMVPHYPAPPVHGSSVHMEPLPISISQPPWAAPEQDGMTRPLTADGSASAWPACSQVRISMCLIKNCSLNTVRLQHPGRGPTAQRINSLKTLISLTVLVATPADPPPIENYGFWPQARVVGMTSPRALQPVPACTTHIHQQRAPSHHKWGSSWRETAPPSCTAAPGCDPTLPPAGGSLTPELSPSEHLRG